MPAVSAALTAAQKRRLNRWFRIPGDVRAGDIFDALLTQTDLTRIIGQATNLSILNHVIFVAPVALTITSLKVIFDVNDVGGATTASHTFTMKKNNAGTAISSLVSVATINKGVVTDLGAIAAVSAVLAPGDTITSDIITGSTSAASQNGVVIVNYKVNVTSLIGDPIP